ncbi:MAG: hypothetical protein K6F50_01985 [Kiritimatiellae bacterium]|nr:hypothetical protein [Kiritimatiellia bacterium]
MRPYLSLLFAVAATSAAFAAPVIRIERGGSVAKQIASVEVSGDPAFRQTLERNLVLSGAFQLSADPSSASIRVTGASGGEIVVAGAGKRLSMKSRAGDAKSARSEARRLSDKMCETFAGQKGFASDRLAFVVKNGRSEELCSGYADGGDMRQLTKDGKASIGPRWKDSGTLYYTGYLRGAPEIYEIDAVSGARRLMWGFGGLTTGAAASPRDGRVAIILSKAFGNPELCVIDPANGTWSRLTKTKTGNEGQPCWSPDGSSIAYVSDESRRQHIYIIDPATKAKRRLTSTGNNVDPDWGPDGRIVYTTRRGGQSQIAVLSPAEDDATAQLVTQPGSWEHPTWTRDGRHVIAERDGVLFLVDTLPDGDAPRKLFGVKGRSITPTMSR